MGVKDGRKKLKHDELIEIMRKKRKDRSRAERCISSYLIIAQIIIIIAQITLTASAPFTQEKTTTDPLTLAFCLLEIMFLLSVFVIIRNLYTQFVYL